MSLRISSAEELTSRINAGEFEETHYVEVKRSVPSGRGANKELARDLAALGVDGGQLILGVAENKELRQFEAHPLDLAGLAERIDQVVAEHITPRLTIRCQELPLEDGRGFLIVEVPPSPDAPHMVDGKYWGRGDTTKRVLPDPEVHALHARRDRHGTDFTEMLRLDVERDPTRPDAREQAHLFILARPTTGRPAMLHDALSSDGTTLRQWAQQAIQRGSVAARLAWPTGAADGVRPDFVEMHPSTRARGLGLATWDVGPNRVPRPNGDRPIDERSLLDLEIDEDGSVHLFSAAGTDTWKMNGASGRAVITPLPAMLLIRLLRTVVVVSDAASYMGSWDTGIHITNLRGAESSRRLQGFRDASVQYTEMTYERVGQYLLDSVRDDEQRVTRDLLGQFYRGLGESLLDQ